MAAGNRVFQLKLWKSYYDKGFFNVPVEFDDLAADDGPLTLVLPNGEEIATAITRRANRNGTARVNPKSRLGQWFRENYPLNGTVSVRFDAPRRWRLG